MPTTSSTSSGARANRSSRTRTSRVTTGSRRQHGTRWSRQPADAAHLGLWGPALVRGPAGDTCERHFSERRCMENLIAPFLNGTAQGGLLLIAALGLALTFGQMGVINMAHGEFLLAGALCAYWTQQ